MQACFVEMCICCSVLQRVAACCSVLQRVAACCSALPMSIYATYRLHTYIHTFLQKGPTSPQKRPASLLTKETYISVSETYTSVTWPTSSARGGERARERQSLLGRYRVGGREGSSRFNTAVNGFTYTLRPECVYN